jgi:hypothetical protein
MSKDTRHIEKDVELQRQKKLQRKRLLQRLTKEIDEQEVEQAVWFREMELTND